MKKRIEKVVECVKIGNKITMGNFYLFLEERGDYCYITNDKGNVACYHKQYFKVVSAKEVLEFEWVDFAMSDIDRTKYDLKVIATPKDKTYEEMSKEELIELLKSKE